MATVNHEIRVLDPTVGPGQTATDVRCDRCNAAAKVRLNVRGGGDLLFCGHHADQHAEMLVPITLLAIVEEGFAWKGLKIDIKLPVTVQTIRDAVDLAIIEVQAVGSALWIDTALATRLFEPLVAASQFVALPELYRGTVAYLGTARVRGAAEVATVRILDGLRSLVNALATVDAQPAASE